MKTIEIKVFSFGELNEEAKQKAINKYLEAEDFYFIWQEAENTVNQFIKLFPLNLKTSYRSWLEPNFYSIEDNIRELKGLRLRTWLINNLSFLYKKEYLKSFKEKKEHKNIKQKTWGSVYYSSWKIENCCVLTGVCYDNDLLDPIYNFIEKYSESRNNDSVTFEEIIEDCFNSLEKSINNEIEYLQSDDAIKEYFEENVALFYENGERHY